MTNSVIDPSAKIDSSVKIGPFCVIGPDVEIGPNCVLHSHVVIKGPTKISDGNIFYQFSTIGEDTPDKKYAGEATTLEIGKEASSKLFESTWPPQQLHVVRLLGKSAALKI